jgi:hypothetical protein
VAPSWPLEIGKEGCTRMTKIKLTKTAVDAATFAAKEYELRDTVVPGFPPEGNARWPKDIYGPVSH